MKFVYDGTYTEFMGRMFAFGREVEVTDRATIAALEKRSDFRKVREAVMEEKKPLPDACPKCGKIVKRGKFMHQKYCK